MARFNQAAAGVETAQISAGSTPQPIDADGNVGPTNRILLKASTAGIYVGGNKNVTTSSGAEIPTTSYLPLWMDDPSDLYVVGASGTVCVIFETPEGNN